MKHYLSWTVIASLMTLVLSGPALAASEVVPFVIDTGSSRVSFHVRSTGHGFEGVAEEVRGSLTLGREGYEDGAGGTIEVPVEAMKTGIGMRDRIMWGETLEAKTYPVIRFETTGLEPAAGLFPAGRTFVVNVSGNLSIHGVERPVTVPVRVTRTGEGIVLDGTFAVQLPEHKITPPSFLFFRVKDEVKVAFHLMARPDQTVSKAH